MVATFNATMTVAANPSTDDSMTATVIYNGVRTTFNQKDADDLGNYVDPKGKFTQQCFMAKPNAALPGLLVMFRPDLGSTRKEIVVELGQAPTPAITPPVTMGAYTVELAWGGQVKQTINVPTHYWFSRWRWYTEPRPVRATRQEIIASRLVPNYDSSVLGRYLANCAPRTYSIMGLAGIYPVMGSTGERDDIGIVTNQSANWLCNGAIQDTVLAQGEAAGTLSMHVRDLATGGPIDLFAYPKATGYAPSAGSPFVQYIKGAAAYDDGHSPALSLVPWLMTGDPYNLEELQFQCISERLQKPPAYRDTGAGRYGAWTLRNRLYAAKSTPAVVPRWLLPKAHFEQMMETMRQAVLASMASTDPVYAVFRTRGFGGSQGNIPHPAGTYTSWWQVEFETSIHSLCVQLGYTQWAEPAAWVAHATIQRTNGTFWPRCVPAPYMCQLVHTTSLSAPCGPSDTIIYTDKFGGPPWPDLPMMVVCQSEKMWVTAVDMRDPTKPAWTVQRGYAGSAAVSHAVNLPILGSKFTTWERLAVRENTYYPEEVPRMPGDTTGMNELYHASAGSPVYSSYTHGALAIARDNGVTEADASFAWIDAQFRRWTSPQWAADWKWCIASVRG